MITDGFEKHIIDKGLFPNDDVLKVVSESKYDILAIEMVASYGMAVGQTVFDTCVWIGRFTQAALSRGKKYAVIYRMDEKLSICHDSRAKDCNIRQALINMYGNVGTLKNKGFFYGFKKDMWAAFAVNHTFWSKIEECCQKGTYVNLIDNERIF